MNMLNSKFTKFIFVTYNIFDFHANRTNCVARQQIEARREQITADKRLIPLRRATEVFLEIR